MCALQVCALETPAPSAEVTANRLRFDGAQVKQTVQIPFFGSLNSWRKALHGTDSGLTSQVSES